jgi:excisionase family DNA binding protein
MGQKITLDAAADELGISKRTVRRLISSGDLRAYLIGRNRLVRIDRDDLTDVMHEVVPNGKP